MTYLCTLQMVPLVNLSLNNISFGLLGKTNYTKSTINFSLAARSYNDKYEAWEPLIEPADGFLRFFFCSYSVSFYGSLVQKCLGLKPLWLRVISSVYSVCYNGYVPLGCRYQFNPRSVGAVSELRLTSTKDLNVNVSVSNANTIIQAYASWNSLSNVHEYHKERVRTFPLVLLCHILGEAETLIAFYLLF